MIIGTKIAKERETKNKNTVLIAIIILSNVTQGTAIIGHESQFYGQFAEQAQLLLGFLWLWCQYAMSAS